MGFCIPTLFCMQNIEEEDEEEESAVKAKDVLYI